MATPWDDLIRLINRIWSAQRAITTKSDFAREWTNEIAEASARGLISTQVFPRLKLYGNQWKVTLEGLRYMEELTEGMPPGAIQELLGLDEQPVEGLPELSCEDSTD